MDFYLALMIAVSQWCESNPYPHMNVVVCRKKMVECILSKPARKFTGPPAFVKDCLLTEDVK